MAQITVDAIHLPADIERGAEGGPEYSTIVYPGDGGRLATNQLWEAGRITWSFAYGVMTKNDFEDLITFFRGRRGMARGFLFKDFADFEIARQVIGVGDGVQTDYPIFKTYDDDVNPENRRITRPVTGTVRVWVNNIELTITTQFTVLTTGIVHLITPAGVSDDVEVECEFDVAVMFTTDKLNLNMLHENAGSYPNLGIMEILEFI